MADSMRNRTFAAGVVALVTLGTLAACGGDSSTAKSSSTASPSVVVPANPTVSGTVEKTTPNPHSGNSDAVDGGITEITELPSVVRSSAEDAFLAELKDKGVKITDQAVQDQVLAVGLEQCQANDEGRDSFSVPAIAGQLNALGMTDKDPEVVATAIKAAAEDHLCS